MAGDFSVLRTNSNKYTFEYNATLNAIHFVHTHKLRVLTLPRDQYTSTSMSIIARPSSLRSSFLFCLNTGCFVCAYTWHSACEWTISRPLHALAIMIVYCKNEFILEMWSISKLQLLFCCEWSQWNQEKINKIRVNNGNDTDNGEMKMN